MEFGFLIRHLNVVTIRIVDSGKSFDSLHEGDDFRYLTSLSPKSVAMIADVW